MDRLRMKQAFLSHEGLVFTAMFTLIFTVTSLIMIDYRGLQSHVAGMDPFTILTLGAILAYLYKNSKFSFSRRKILFLIVWGLYVLSVFASMLVAGHFVWTEAAVWVMLTVMLLYRMPAALFMYIAAGALISLPSLLLAGTTLNESGATLVMVFAAGLIFMPKTNRALLWYMLPTLALLVVITTSRTAMALYLLAAAAQSAHINMYRTGRRQRKNFLMTAGAVILVPLIMFGRRLYSYFIQGSLDRGGINFDRLTSGRYEPWQTVVSGSTWFGQGHDYVDFTHLLHVHNIIFDTLGRYGILTAVLFIALLSLTVLISVIAVKNFNITLFFIIFILAGMFEYNYLFMFVYFSPVILFFALIGLMMDDRDSGHI
ncbi:O-antigen ligase domain-containing protein [Salinicoccus carnicancri]|uniref:O-antigen ligase domain-containing protein n=1 Tax=Salinicoccus carnicancri TaxID=558170 RepID=UPI0012EA67CC|nr:O-antigen ligase domain-containing protein [Salinicoccus carnicancri]